MQPPRTPPARGDESPSSEGASLEEKVLAERIRLLYKQTLIAQLVSVANATLVVYVFWAKVPPARGLAWLLGQLALAAVRLGLWAAFRARSPDATAAPRWAWWFTLCAAGTGLLWGASPVLFSGVSFTEEIFLAFVLAGMSAGAASANGAVPPAVVAFVAPALLPIATQLLAHGDRLHTQMAAMVTVFGTACVVLLRSAYRTADAYARTRFRNEALVGNLAQAKQDLVRANADLERRVAERTAELSLTLAERSRSEARLARFRALLDQSGAAVLVADADRLEVVDANDRACALLETTRERLTGSSLADVTVGESLQGEAPWRALVERVAASGTTTIEEPRRDRGGGSAVLELVITLQSFEGGRYLLVSGRDVTQRKEMERDLAQAALQVGLGRLTAALAHEINNPLSYVIGNLAFVGKQADEPDGTLGDPSGVREAIRDALDGALRVRDIVRELGVLARGDSGTLTPIDLHRLLGPCLELGAKALRGRARIVTDWEEEIPPVLASDVRLTQLFTSLLANAIDGVPAATGDKDEIRVRVRGQAGGRVLVEIADTARSIPAAELERIFDPSVGGGAESRTGLGLPICHALAVSVGGQLSARPEPGGGVCFSVSLRAAGLPA
jgi:PAS domain S-box-containing protein